jgi:hypothetical protein
MTLTWTRRADERKVGAWNAMAGARNANTDAIATKAPCIYGGYHFAHPATQRLQTDWAVISAECVSTQYRRR